jgi:superfamily II DNA or RNA helicase
MSLFDLIKILSKVSEDASELFQPQVLRHLSGLNEDFFRLLKDYNEIFVRQKLKDYQIDHVQGIMSKIRSTKRIFDVSKPGCGKSYTACAIARLGCKTPVVICPGSAVYNWQLAAKHFALNIKIIKYTDFLCNKKPFLKYIGPDEIVQYTWDEEYYTMCQNGILLVLDECHFLKNDSNTSEYIKILTKVLFRAKNKKFDNWLMMLSGTPFTEVDGLLRLLKVSNVWTEKLLSKYNPRTGFEFIGLEQMLNFCKQNGFPHAEMNCEGRVPKNQVSKHIAYNLYTDYIKKILWTSMLFLNTQSDIKNCFIQVSEANRFHAMQQLAVVNQNMNTVGLQALDRVMKGLQAIELAKVDSIVELINKRLNEPDIKIIVCVNYKRSFNELLAKLNRHDPLVITGDQVKNKDFVRRKIRDTFNDDKKDRRILLAMTELISTGMDLDDKTGKFKRLMIISPSYYLIRVTQVVGRINRADSYSPGEVMLIYAHGIGDELRVYERLKDKGDYMKNGSLYSEKLFTDYPKVILASE